MMLNVEAVHYGTESLSFSGPNSEKCYQKEIRWKFRSLWSENRPCRLYKRGVLHVRLGLFDFLIANFVLILSIDLILLSFDLNIMYAYMHTCIHMYICIHNMYLYRFNCLLSNDCSLVTNANGRDSAVLTY